MATRRKKMNSAELTGNTDPRAPLDGAALLDAAKPLLKTLAADLLKRADDSPAVTAALQARHEKERKAERTGDAYLEWRRGFVEQVAAAWLLSCVFVRTLEDRGLLGRNRIAGPGAQDGWKAFLQLAPSLSEREYLLMVFRELARLPAAADLFDARHNPVWLLAPSAGAARQLMDVFRAPNTDAPSFRFGGDDTRFLGDLYESLSDEARQRYALLQTPHFVETFILDHTLEPAIERFGLDGTNVIDPTCGSGHFLVGAFERLFERRLQLEPALPERVAAVRALSAIVGIDINPFAIAIARFRLILSVLSRCHFRQLRDAPALSPTLAVADSLAEGPQIAQENFAHLNGSESHGWEDMVVTFEGSAAARRLLHRTYQVVVGNPPYSAPSNLSRKGVYKRGYRSARGKFNLSGPFVELMFRLACERGFCGMINAQSFAVSDFGIPLVTEVLPRYRIAAMVATGGVYFPPPGFGTPTLILLGTKEAPGGKTLIVKEVRKDGGDYADAATGAAWQGILGALRSPGAPNEYVSSELVDQRLLSTHPWQFVASAGTDFVDLLEGASLLTLRDYCDGPRKDPIGFVAISGSDEGFIEAPAFFRRHAVADRAKHHLKGELIRDYQRLVEDMSYWPYSEDGELLPLRREDRRVLEPLYPWLSTRAAFDNRTYALAGRTYYEWHQVSKPRMAAQERVLFPGMGTELHFVLDDSGATAAQSLLCLILKKDLARAQTHALLAYLNSAALNVWFRRRCPPASTARGDISKVKGRSETERHKLSGGLAQRIPVPDAVMTEQCARLAWLGERLLDLGRQRETYWRDVVASSTDALVALESEDRRLLEEGVVLQEEVDWTVWALVLGRDLPLSPLEALAGARAAPDERPGTAGGIGHSLPGLSEEIRAIWKARTVIVSQHADVAAVEQRLYKRGWSGRRGVFGRQSNKGPAERQRALVATELAEHACRLLGAEKTPRSAVEVTRLLQGDDRAQRSIESFADEGHDVVRQVEEMIRAQSIPFLSAAVFTEEGLEGWGTWNRLRFQDSVATRPPEFVKEHFLRDEYFRLRGRLNIEREGFISYPGCEGEEGELVFGSTAWSHLDRAVVLAGLYQDRKEREGWSKDRLLPMLAGLLELLPWLRQWHNEPNEELGGEKPCAQFEAFLNAECGELGFTHDDLRACRPAVRIRAANNAGAHSKKAGEELEAAEEK